MKKYGDMPPCHLDHIGELTGLESYFYKNRSKIQPLAAAMGMVCLAHDYYIMDLEEEGDRLLNMAEKIYPGYFKGPIYIHIKEEREFAFLIEQLKDTLGWKHITGLGFNDKQN